MNISKEINRIVKLYGKKEFISNEIDKKSINYNEFYSNSLEVLSFLQSKKIKPGDKVLVNLDNSIEYFYLFFACLLGNYVICPIDIELKHEKIKELEKILKPKIKILKKNNIKFLKRKTIPTIRKNSPYLIIFTSGTTGKPKGIQISNSSYIGSSISYAKLAGYENETNLLHFLPMYYNAGILNTFFSCFFSGSKITLINKISALNIYYFWEKIDNKDINYLQLTPEIANSLTKLKVSNNLKEQIKKIKFVSTGSYLHQNIVDKFEKHFDVRILSCYGLTEIGGPLTIQNWENTFITGSVGYHSKEIKIKIYNKNEKNILIKSPYIMDGYINEHGKLSKPKLKNGFFDTGDIGSYKNGELTIIGRRKDIIKKGAEIVSLASIENTILKNEIVDEVTGISKNDQIKGSKIFMFIKFNKVKKVDKMLNKLENYIKRKLKKIEIPDKLIPVPEIPKTYNGKPKKNILEKIYL